MRFFVSRRLVSLHRNPELTHNEFEKSTLCCSYVRREGEAIINIQLRDLRAASAKGEPKVTQPKD